MPRKRTSKRPPRRQPTQEEPEQEQYTYDPEEISELFGTDIEDDLLIELQGTALAMARGEFDLSTAQFNSLKMLMEQRQGRPFTNDAPSGEQQVQRVEVVFTDANQEDAPDEASDESTDAD